MKIKKSLTEGQKAFDLFLDNHKFPKGDTGFMPPSMTAEEALEILRLHFAGGYYTTSPMNGKQFNCELVHYILNNYRGKR